ncbi:MAG: hypothetical protein RIR41_234 [Pseudomonadota bacterium]|jgi:uncharacterized membrane protein|nr:DUF2244 domain-containing protein [Hyphomonadaceae bacterium]
MAIVYLDAVLEPPRSLTTRGLNRVMLILGAFSAVFSLGFLLVGAWPVVGFLGAEILVLWLVFQWSFRAQTARTYVRVTADEVDVRKVDGWGRERRASMASHFARVEFDRTATGPNALRLATSRTAYPLGEFLTPRERETFARRLMQAISDARRERHTQDNA